MKTETIFIQGLNQEVIFHIGKNQSENFEVIDKGTSDDIWFHAKNDSSCHVVSEIPSTISNKKQLSYIIKMGALLCKQNTNKLKSLKNVEIMFSLCKNIIKTPIPGTVITSEYKTILC